MLEDKKYLPAGGDITTHLSTAAFSCHFPSKRAHTRRDISSTYSALRRSWEKMEGSLKKKKKNYPRNTRHMLTQPRCNIFHGVFQRFKCAIEIKPFLHTSLTRMCQKINLVQPSIDGKMRGKKEPLLSSTVFCDLRGQRWNKHFTYTIYNLKTWWLIDLKGLMSHKNRVGKSPPRRSRYIF